MLRVERQRNHRPRRPPRNDHAELQRWRALLHTPHRRAASGQAWRGVFMRSIGICRSITVLG
jgi:hypothetical protein